MPRYEFLLISQLFQHPRQFELVSAGRLTGDKLSSILLSSFPNQYWYFGQDSLESLGSLASGQKLILSDIPQVQPEYIDQSATLKLYVPHGPDSGAWISLTQGEHSIGRGGSTVARRPTYFTMPRDFKCFYASPTAGGSSQPPDSS
ncbi:hypothetical protein AAHB37_06700 [Glutamicibacter halophytocola]|uniref:hypothetical protein n=1 Tax=Glutamicibacter halophytocola TaxID=1933880 RepID=UPI00321A3CFC